MSESFVHRYRLYVIAIGLAAMVAIIYLSTLGFDFINLDDDQYITNNPAVRGALSFSFLKWAFTSFYAANWHPVTWISHALDVQLFGVAAGGAHAVNLLLHTANSILLFFLVRLLSGRDWESAAVAMIFAIHPAHVESVAWIAERKDVLSTLFWILSTFFYVRFVRDSANRGIYFISLLFFAIGLAAKPMLVTLPFTLLLLDYWPLARMDSWNVKTIWPLVREKLPFFTLSIASSIVTVFAQSAGGAIQSTTVIPFAERVSNAIVAYAKYLATLFYPVDLGIWYPFQGNLDAVTIGASIILIAGISAICIWQIKTRKYLFVGWFWFLGTLVPVIGLLQVGRQSMADRYTYVPYIGLSIAIVWFFSELITKFKLPVAMSAATGGLIGLVLTVMSLNQVSYWKNTETISLRTLSVTRNNYLIESNYCNYLEKQNRLDDAVIQCQAAIEHDPTLIEAYNNLGTVQIKQNKFDDARANFDKVIELDPSYSLAYANLAKVETSGQNVAKAYEYMTKALKNDRNGFFDNKRKTEAFSTLASTAMKLQRYDVAADSYKQAMDASPENTEIQRNLALAYRMSGRPQEAVTLLLEVIRKNPNSAEAHNTLGTIYAEQNRKPEAVQQFQRALQINPNFAQAQANLKKVGE